MKTIHTAAPATEVVRYSFPGVVIREITRVSPDSAEAKFKCSLSAKNLESACKAMGWQLPDDKSSLDKLDGKLNGGNFILTAKLDDDERLKIKSKDGTVDPDAEIDIEYSHVLEFQLHRFEIEGRKKKGFRRELRFKITFPEKCMDAMANLESYMVRTGNGKGTLKVLHIPDPVQEVFPETQDEAADDQQELDMPEVQATTEQREAVEETETGTLASVRQMGAKRGRLNREAN